MILGVIPVVFITAILVHPDKVDKMGRFNLLDVLGNTKHTELNLRDKFSYPKD